MAQFESQNHVDQDNNMQVITKERLLRYLTSGIKERSAVIR